MIESFIFFALFLTASGITAGFALAAICAPYNVHKGKLPGHIWSVIFLVTFFAAMPTLLAFLALAKGGGTRAIVFPALVGTATAMPFFVLVEKLKRTSVWSIVAILVAALLLFAASLDGLANFSDARRELYRACRVTDQACQKHIDTYWSLPAEHNRN